MDRVLFRYSIFGFRVFQKLPLMKSRNRDVTDRVEAVPIDRQRERHKVRVGDKRPVILADRGLADRRLFLFGHENRIHVVKLKSEVSRRRGRQEYQGCNGRWFPE
jgi:hypothetical protein